MSEKNSLLKLSYAIYGLECFAVIKKSKKLSQQFSLVIPFQAFESDTTILDMTTFQKQLNPILVFPAIQMNYFNIFLDKKNQIKKYKISFARWIAFYSTTPNIQNKLYLVACQYFMLKPYMVLLGENKLLPKLDEKTMMFSAANHIFMQNQNTQQTMVSTIKKQLHIVVYKNVTFSVFKILVNFISVYECKKKITYTKKTQKNYILSCNSNGSGFIFFLYNY